MRLYLVRHARPIVDAGVCYGSSDLAADEGHQRQVLAELVRALPRDIRVVSSPLRRCLGLAEGLSRALQLPEPVVDARLVEMDFGSWELQPWATIPREEIDAWAANLANYRPGGGECLIDVARRVRSFHDDILRSAHPAAVVIAHAGTIRLMLAAAQVDSAVAMVNMAAANPNHVAYGELTTLDCQTDNDRCM